MKYLYCIDNNITGKRYIGVTIDPDRRWKQHTNPKSKKNSAIKDAIVKYGKENFTMTLLCFDEDKIIDNLEREAIKHFNTQIPNGYNITIGGDGASYREWDEDWNKLLGTMNDTELGERLGYHASTIKDRREALGIDNYHITDWNKYHHLLGTLPDKEIAEMLGIKANAVQSQRSLRGIPPYHQKPELTSEFFNMLGKVPDEELMEKFQRSKSTLRRHKKKMGII